MNKKEKMKLQFIESGRLSNPEMNSIFGGNWSCGTYYNCHVSGKSTCTNTYTDCPTATDKSTNCTGTDSYAFIIVTDFTQQQERAVMQNSFAK